MAEFTAGQTGHAQAPVILAVATAPERRIIERSDILDHGAKCLQTGIGPEQVQMMSERIMRDRPAGLVSIGTSGGLSPALLPGRLLLPMSVVSEDGQMFSVADEWHARVHRQLDGQNVETGTIASVAQALRSPDEKRRLQARSGAVAVDMESGALARIAADYSIPFLVVRAIADPHDAELPSSALAALTVRGDIDLARLLGCLLRRPGDLLGLARLGVNFRAADRTLDACCRAARAELCDPR